jgi:ribosome-associated protein
LLGNTILQAFIVDKIDDIKAQNITTLDVRGKSTITDYLVICTGTSSRHVMSIADHLLEQARAAGIDTLGSEGRDTGEWIVVDLGETIVHVMQEESRELYQLEKLWS